MLKVKLTRKDKISVIKKTTQKLCEYSWTWFYNILEVLMTVTCEVGKNSKEKELSSLVLYFLNSEHDISEKERRI